MSAASIKTRASAKRLFTRANNAVANAIQAADDAELVGKKFQDLEKRYSDVQERHEEFVCIVEDTEEYNEKECDVWINEIEDTFTCTERKSHNYIKTFNDDIKRVNDDNKSDKSDQSSTHEEKPASLTVQERCCTLRDFERTELINEAEIIKS